MRKKANEVTINECPECNGQIRILIRMLAGEAASSNGVFAICSRCKKEYYVCGLNDVPVYDKCAKTRKSVDNMVKHLWNKMQKAMREKTYVKLYKKFRVELDSICIPEIIKETPNVTPITMNEKVIGIICGTNNYIDCLYVLPEYRRQGYGKRAALEYVNKHLIFPGAITLHIINKNEPAKNFWNNLFELEEVETNSIDTLYEIISIKETFKSECIKEA